MTKDVFIRTGKEPVSKDHPDGVLPGQVVEVSVTNAHKYYPNAKILGYADGSTYQETVTKASKTNAVPGKAQPTHVVESDKPVAAKE